MKRVIIYKDELGLHLIPIENQELKNKKNKIMNQKLIDIAIETVFICVSIVALISIYKIFANF